MADCCSTDSSSANSAVKQMSCPMCHTKSNQVPFKTVIQHLRKPWHNEFVQKHYYFCEELLCEVIYFTEDNSIIRQAVLRTQVGIKSPKELQSLICYCFDISYKEALKNKTLMQYVIDKTKNQDCSCESQNPSGRCCLKDFKRLYNS